MPKNNKIVIIPTYNEIENIASMLEHIFCLEEPFDVLIVDDNSPDGTATLVTNLVNERYSGRLFLEKRAGKMGLGTAYIFGFQWALKAGYDYIFEMDADFSHNPSDLTRLYQACANGLGDMAVGSRYIKDGYIENWPLLRKLYSKGGAIYTYVLTQLPVKDPTAGFVCYTRAVLEAIDFNKIQFVGYAFQIEMKFAVWKIGFKIVEIPIRFKDRKLGSSKMNNNILKEGILGVLKIQWNSLFKNYKYRVGYPK